MTARYVGEGVGGGDPAGRIGVDHVQLDELGANRGEAPKAAGEGDPAHIVPVAGRGWPDPVPDIVLSDFNVGANVGRVMLHSGTVGAALTAVRHGWQGLPSPWRPLAHAPAASLGDTAAAVLALRSPAPTGTVLSLNFPDRPAAALRDVRLPPDWGNGAGSRAVTPPSRS